MVSTTTELCLLLSFLVPATLLALPLTSLLVVRAFLRTP